ncbi:transmembrane protein 222-like [Ornithodoros turicata]
MPSKPAIDFHRDRFPFCIVWTTIPCITWFLPFVGHMGIATSSGIIRDFAGPYFVSEDNMAFGRPTKYWPLDPSRATDGAQGWDRAVAQASDVYKGRMHNLFCDNCHSHVALALNLMQYGGSGQWNMVTLTFLMLIHGKYVSIWGFLKTWMPFLVLVCIIAIVWLSFTRH